MQGEGSRNAPSTWREVIRVRTRGLGGPGRSFPGDHGPCLGDREKREALALAGLSAGTAWAVLVRSGGLRASGI